MSCPSVPEAVLKELVGESREMVRLRDRLLRLSAHPVNVVLQGESGTGKELAAGIIHRISRRRDGPFVGINCAAIHESLLESELFGHEAGAFTGAKRAAAGLFRAADGGTILLDEVGDMSAGLQTKLLRTLEDHAVIPVGGVEPIALDVRVIAATHKDLSELVRRGCFRTDLYYRLNVVSLTIPPLRERREDIGLLTESLLRKIAAALDVPVKRISGSALDKLIAYDWPGNVRELGNVLQRAYVLGDGPLVEPEDLPACVLKPAHAVRAFPTLEEVIVHHTARALKRTGGIRKEAAALLGINRKRLWRIMSRHFPNADAVPDGTGL